MQIRNTDSANTYLINGLKKPPLMTRFFNVLCLFCYIFQPAISRISIVHLSTLYMFLFVVYHSYRKNGRYLVLNKRLLKYFKAFIPFFLYVTINSFLQSIIARNSNDILHNLIVFYMILFRIVLSFEYLKTIFDFHNYTIEIIIYDMIIVATIQMFFVIMALSNPSARNFFNSLTLKYTNSKYIVRALRHDIWRSYGFAGNIFDAFGYLTAMLIILTFMKGIEENSMLLVILSIGMFIMPLLNARTGLFLAMGGMAVGFIIMKKKFRGKAILKIIFSLVAAVFVFIHLYDILPEATKSWIEVGFNSTRLLFETGQRTGVYESMLHDNFKFPENIIFGVAIEPAIESGYVQCIWRFGIVGSFLLLNGFAYFFISTFRNCKNSFNKSIIASFAAIFFVYLFKLFSIYNYGANIMMIGLPLLFYYSESSEIKHVV